MIRKLLSQGHINYQVIVSIILEQLLLVEYELPQEQSSNRTAVRMLL